VLLIDANVAEDEITRRSRAMAWRINSGRWPSTEAVTSSRRLASVASAGRRLTNESTRILASIVRALSGRVSVGEYGAKVSALGRVPPITVRRPIPPMPAMQALLVVARMTRRSAPPAFAARVVLRTAPALIGNARQV
jgi:hypothetical protein